MLYRGRYLIVLLDSLGEIKYVLDSSLEYSKLKHISHNYACRVLNRVLRGQNPKSRILLIDCIEKHDDIFAEEDEEFLKYLEQEGKHKTNKQRAKEMGIGVRTFYRRGLNKKTWEEFL